MFSLSLLIGSFTTPNSFAQGRRDDNRVRDDFQNDAPAVNSKLNNRRLEKNMDKYADQLQLTKRQQKQLRKIDRRYGRMERKMNRRNDTKRGSDRRRDRKRLSEEKRIEMISVLTPDQQQTLEALSKKGRFSFDQLFGR